MKKQNQEHEYQREPEELPGASPDESPEETPGKVSESGDDEEQPGGDEESLEEALLQPFIGALTAPWDVAGSEEFTSEEVDGGEEPLTASPGEDAPAGRVPLRERVKEHVEAIADAPDLTTEEAYAEIKDSEDLNYDLREDCRVIGELMKQVGSSKFAIGEYIIARHWPPIQITKRGHIYWHEKPKPRYRELVKFSELPCSKSELADCVALQLQKRQLEGEQPGSAGCDHLTVSQLILLTRVKALDDKRAVIHYLKKNPKNYVQTRDWMRAKGYLKAARQVDVTKKLVSSFERVVQDAEENLPALEEADPMDLGFNLLTGWRTRLEAVVSILKELEEEEVQSKAA